MDFMVSIELEFDYKLGSRPKTFMCLHVIIQAKSSE